MYRNTIIRALLVLCTGLVVPAAVSAQGTSVKSAPARNPAEQLETFALAPKIQASDWIEAAQALEQAASLRTAHDPRAVNDLLSAATAYETAGRLVQARKAVVEGARHAFKVGDVYTAANAYVVAARLSIQLRDDNGAVTYLGHAGQLATSPKITPTQKQVIFAQIGRN